MKLHNAKMIQAAISITEQMWTELAQYRTVSQDSDDLYKQIEMICNDALDSGEAVKEILDLIGFDEVWQERINDGIDCSDLRT